jgi:hypothetical protein
MVLSGYFDSVDKLINALSEVTSAEGVYVTPNPVDRALLARANNRITKANKTTTDQDITRRRWLLVDCDPVRPAGISATDEEHDHAIRRARAVSAYLRDAGWPDPILADSGNGTHLLYRIDLPVDDNGLVKRCLEALAAQFDDEKVKIDKSVHNPARIWKLYGTRACKGDSTTERPHRMSRILSTPDSIQVVESDKLECLAASLSIQAAPQKQPLDKRQAFDIDAFIARHKLDVAEPKETTYGRVWQIRTSPLCEHHNDGPFLIQFSNGAIAASCHHNSCEWTWHDLRANYDPATRTSAKNDTLRFPETVCMAEVQAETVAWLWPGRIAIGKVTLLYGDPGLGKSLVTLDIAARVSRGAAWPDKRGEERPSGSVILLSAEDDAADTLRPRLDAHEADCQRIHVLKAIHTYDNKGDHVRAFDLTRDIEQLRQVLDKTPDCRLVIIDPISAYLGKADSHVNADVRAALAPLAELATEKRIAILAVTHLRKGDGAAIHRGMGSMGFVAAARAAWVVAKDKRNPSRRVMLAVKNNLADDGASTGLAYTIEGHGPDGAPVVCWEADPVTLTADEALAAEPKRRGRPPEERECAEEWLRKALADYARPAKELLQEAKEAHCISSRTLERAKHKLGVIAFQKVIPGPWYWRLPDEPVQVGS